MVGENLWASAEKLSEHPLGKAIVSSYQREYEKPLIAEEKFAMLPGRGVSAVLNEKRIVAGNKELLSEQGIEVGSCEEITGFLEQGCTVIYLAADDEYIGYIVLSDTLREESTDVIDRLMRLSIRTVLLTGDNENAAKEIAGRLHISEVYAGCLPEDKLKYIDKYRN